MSSNDIRYKLDIGRKICENKDKEMNFDKYIPLYNKLNSQSSQSYPIPFMFRDIYIKGVMPHIINYPLILRHIY